jgi:hypothetical protein
MEQPGLGVRELFSDEVLEEAHVGCTTCVEQGTH